MKTISCRRYRFPPVIIQHAIWLYSRFSLSYRDVEGMVAERGIDVSYETIRRWGEKLGGEFAKRLRMKRPKPGGTWHIYEVLLRKTIEQSN
jgi:transposase-like protein